MDCGCCIEAKLLFRPDGMITPPEVGTKTMTALDGVPAFPSESVGVKGPVVV